MFSYFKTSGQLKDVYTVGFYNLENLFDPFDDEKTLDDDFTPNGKNNWHQKRYKKKIKKIGYVISKIGLERSYIPPALLGVVEVENKTVLNDLVQSKNLKDYNYDYVHYDSEDERGIDVALLYQKEYFELLHSETFTLLISNPGGERDYTRDILLVKGNLNGELMYTIVNHWPSRRSGENISEENRIKAAVLVQEIVTKIKKETEESKIIILGDFNDNPNNTSIKDYLIKADFYNPMQTLLDKGKGTLKHYETWHLFDQIIFSKNFLIDKSTNHQFKYAEVFDKEFLKVWKGKEKGKPFRTFIGKWYQGGYSDHFPVYIYLEKK